MRVVLIPQIGAGTPLRPLTRCKSLNRRASRLTRGKKRLPPGCRSNARPAGPSARLVGAVLGKTKEQRLELAARLHGTQTQTCQRVRGNGNLLRRPVAPAALC